MTYDSVGPPLQFGPKERKGNEIRNFFFFFGAKGFSNLGSVDQVYLFCKLYKEVSILK